MALQESDYTPSIGELEQFVRELRRVSPARRVPDGLRRPSRQTLSQRDLRALRRAGLGLTAKRSAL